MGYAGGDAVNPTYHDLGTHAEVLQVEFDPAQIEFAQLLELFWSSHDPSRGRGGSQYRPILLCETADQETMALASVDKIRERTRGLIATEIAVNKPFYPAEGYHQKWQLRRRPELLEDLQTNYEGESALLQSVAATKLNAMVGGHMSAEQIARDVERLGLSLKNIETLRAHQGGVARRH